MILASLYNILYSPSVAFYFLLSNVKLRRDWSPLIVDHSVEIFLREIKSVRFDVFVCCFVVPVIPICWSETKKKF